MNRPSPATAPRSGSLIDRLAGFAGDRRGIHALEFALVGPVFMLFVGMIFDVGILLYQQAMIDNANIRASRLIRTGQIQLAGGSVTPFTTQLCTDLTNIVDACTNIQYKVTSAAAFASLSSAVATDGHGNLTGKGTFTPGTSGQDVIVQVAWNRPYIVGWVGNFMNPGGGQVLVSTIAFRNELYN
ncbi:MAG: pilus assembly protein [Alphaproteobacteria bacterium]|nr:pilus assembly protein [Alphaproteobacteria bacterium]